MLDIYLSVYYIVSLIIMSLLIKNKYLFDPFLYVYILFTFSISLTPLNMLIDETYYSRINDFQIIPLLISIVMLLTIFYFLIIEKFSFKTIDYLVNIKLNLPRKYDNIINNKYCEKILIIIFLYYISSQFYLLLGQNVSVKVATTVSSNGGALFSMIIVAFQILAVAIMIKKYPKISFSFFLLNLLLGIMTGSKTYIFVAIFYLILFFEMNGKKIYFSMKIVSFSLLLSPFVFIILSFVQVVRYARGLYDEATLLTSLAFINENKDLVYQNISSIVSGMLNRFDMMYISVFICENREKVENLYSQFILSLIGFIPRFIFPDKPDTGLSITFTPIWIGDYGSGNFGPTTIGSMFFGNFSMIFLSFLVIPIIYTILLTIIKAIILNPISKLLGIVAFIFLSTSIIDSAWPFSLIITKIFGTLLFLVMILFILDFLIKFFKKEKTCKKY